ncbi:ATP-dependent helicase [Thermocrinis sp.]
MAKLNPSQEKVVKHFGSPVMVIAGAGSGKTKTLAHKVEFLIKEKGIRPERILAITFTNKASKEIAERIEKVCSVKLEWVGTFHSFSLKILREKAKLIGIPRQFSVIDREDSEKILKNLLKNKGLDLRKVEELKAYMSKRREDLKPPTDADLEALFEDYINYLRENSLLDFSDLLWELLRLCRLTDLSGMFDYILVDEFQDTNTVQYEIIKHLSKQNICVVGDPNQCIYEWRYARPDNMLRFMREFNPQVIKLEHNYRSKRYIIEVANCVLSASQAEWKDLIPHLISVRGGEEKPVVRRFSNDQEEARWIVEKIKELSKSYPLSQMAILLRVGYLTEIYERALFSASIPYKVVGEVRFFERSEIKDALSFLKVLINRKDRLSFERALEVGTYGIGKSTLNHIEKFYSEDWLRACQLSLKTLSPTKASALYQFLIKLQKIDLTNYAQSLEEFLGSIEFFERLKERYPKNWLEREENVKELFRYLREKEKEGYTIQEVLEEINLVGGGEEEANGVKLMTIHASKGLEFSVVFLPRLEEGILPHEKSLNNIRELEEERRLFYVAITRAKDLLFMSYTKNDKSKPSRFLSDIDKRFLDLSAFKKETPAIPELVSTVRLKVGQQVIHRVFGKGKVIKLEGEKVTVDFDGKIKTIYCTFLEPL